MPNSSKLLVVIKVLKKIFRLIAGAEIRVKRSEPEVDSNGRCVTEQSWKEDCNNCWCVEGGSPACTLRGCIHITENIVSIINIKPSEEPSK